MQYQCSMLPISPSVTSLLELLQEVKCIMTENNMEVIGNVMKMHNFKALLSTSQHIKIRDFYTYYYAILVPFTSINTGLYMNNTTHINTVRRMVLQYIG